LIVCPGKIKTNISINALTEDGKKHNKMDESHKDAMSAEICVSKIIEALKNNKEELLVGGKEIKAVWLKRFFPNFLTRILRKQSPF
jgi:short-subunit dehydrogenase